MALSYGDAKCCFRIASCGQVGGLDCITLKNPIAGEEAGYLLHLNRKLRRLWPAVISCYIFITFLTISRELLKQGLPWQQSEDQKVVHMAVFYLRAGGIVLGLVQIVILKSSRLSACVGSANTERLNVFLAIYALNLCLGRYYIAKLFGHDDPSIFFSPDELPYTDTSFVLNLVGVLLVNHLAPMRWCSLFFLEIATLIVYGLPVCFSWTPEPRKIECLLHFATVVCWSSYGKRQIEVNHRVVFSSLLNEKTLRVEAEFELAKEQQKHRNDRTDEHDRTSNASSEAATATTGEVFFQEGSLPLSLHGMLAVGKKEQWVIDQKELTVDPESCLGEGGFGMVFAGEFNESPVALKVLSKVDRNRRSLFAIANELRLLRKLRHSNIVLFHGACFDLVNSDVALVMERVAGMSMDAFLKCAPSPDEHLQIFGGICHGLMYLHTRRPAIVHGDLKPGNIMIEQRGSKRHAKIHDFGLARLITPKARPGGGTLRWMSPEMLRGDEMPSASSDVFALGLIIFYASTGKKPFEDLSEKAIKAHARVTMHTDSALMWPVQYSEFAASCRGVVDLCTRRLPQERPSVRDAHRMIREIGLYDSEQSKVAACASDFWGGLLIARQSMAAKKRYQQFKFWRWLEKVKFAEGLANPIALVPIKEELAIKDAEDLRSSIQNPTLAYPGFPATPIPIMKTSLVHALLSWNCTLSSDDCCDYHAVLDVVQSLHDQLKRNPCQKFFASSSAHQQCPVCSIVFHKDQETTGDDSDRFVCDMCGFEGLARRCDSALVVSL